MTLESRRKLDELDLQTSSSHEQTPSLVRR